MMRASRWRKCLHAALFLVGAAPAVLLLLTAVDYRDAQAMRTRLLQRELRDKLALAARHDEWAQRLRDMRPILADLERRLPRRLDRAAIERDVHAAADRAAAQTVSLDTTAAEYLKEGFYAELPVHAVMRGSAAQLLTFMDEFLRAAPLRRVTQMHWENAADAGDIRQLTFDATFFRYIDVEDF